MSKKNIIFYQINSVDNLVNLPFILIILRVLTTLIYTCFSTMTNLAWLLPSLGCFSVLTSLWNGNHILTHLKYNNIFPNTADIVQVTWHMDRNFNSGIVDSIKGGRNFPVQFYLKVNRKLDLVLLEDVFKSFQIVKTRSHKLYL